jgi:hypothetical protein
MYLSRQSPSLGAGSMSMASSRESTYASFEQGEHVRLV